MRSWGSFVLVVSISVLGLAIPGRARGMIWVDAGGGWFCNFSTVFVDHGDAGVLLTGVFSNCSYGSGGGGGGGSDMPPDKPPPDPITLSVSLSELDQSSISVKLACALDKYTKPNARKKYSIKNANGYAYSRGNEMMYTKTWVNPSSIGPGWAPVAGTTKKSAPHTTLIFNLAYHPHLDPNGATRYYRPEYETGNPSGFATVWNDGFTNFEMSLMSAAHELAHQNGIALEQNETWANWYGYAAVLAYRSDHGAKCN